MNKKSRIFIVLNGVMGLIFIFAAVAQYNDPDAVRWVALYGAAALCCILWLYDRLRRIIPAVVGILALIWAGFVVPDVIGHHTFGREMFRSFKMNDIGVEQAREMGGLLIVAVWMIVLAIGSKVKSGKV